MAQLFSTIFFSAAAMTALCVLFAMILDNISEVRRALGMADASPALASRRVRIRQAERAPAVRPPAAGTPLRAAA